MDVLRARLPRPRTDACATARSCTRSSRAAAELPVGWTDRQDGGTYRLERRDDEARFGFAVGPHSWKQFLFPPRSGSGRRAANWRRRARGRGGAARRRSRSPSSACDSCDLHAIATQDRVFLGGRFVDRDYAARREDAFVVAANCFEPGGTCFCVSMGTGPRAEAGYDLALTEILEGEHRLLVEVGTERGAEILGELASRPAHQEDVDAAGRAVERAVDADGAADGRRAACPTCSQATSSTRAGTTSPSAASAAGTASSSARRASARRSRITPISPASTRSAGAPGTRASRSTTRTSTAVASAPTTARGTGSG